MRFSEIIGLEETKKQLVTAVKENHVAHAQLFFGQEGSANLAMALAYSTYVNCENPSENDSCGECPSCQKIDKLVHPDVHFVFPVSSTKKITGKNVVSASFLTEWRSFALSNPYGNIEDWTNTYNTDNKQSNISKEESRNIIRDLSLKAFDAKYKIMLIWLPEYMHVTAANGILKILEEPAENTLFLLVTQDYEKLLTTILSRCQLFKIPAFSQEDIVKYLEKEQNLVNGNAKQIAALAEGSISKAVQLMDKVEDDTHVMFRDWMRLCWIRNFAELSAMNDKFSSINKTGQMMLMQYGLNIMRESLMSNMGVSDSQRLNAEEAEFVQKFGTALSLTALENISKELNKGHYHISRNANTKILFMDTSLSIGRIMTKK